MTPCSSKRWSLHRSQYGSVVENGKKWCLLVDEVERLADSHDSGIALDNLRHLVSNSAVAGEASVVLAGGLDVAVRLRSSGSSLTNVCATYELEPLEHSEVQELVTLGVPAADIARTLSYVWAQAGGHPYLAQLILESLPVPVPGDLESAGEPASADGRTRVARFLDQIDPLVFDAAERLASGTQPPSHLSPNIAAAGLARRESDDWVINGEIVRRAFPLTGSRVGAPVARPDPTWVHGLLGEGETSTIEFKESIRWDVNRQTENDALKYEIPLTVAGFMNADGGTLLIGVADDGRPVGLGADIALNRRNPTIDGATLLVANLLRGTIGGDNARHVRFASALIDDMPLIALTVEPSPRPVFTEFKGAVQFHVRIGPATMALDPRETVAYVLRHWPEIDRV